MKSFFYLNIFYYCDIKITAGTKDNAKNSAYQNETLLNENCSLFFSA